MGKGICVLMAAVLFAGPLPAEIPKKAAPRTEEAFASGGQGQLPPELKRKLEAAEQTIRPNISPATIEKLARTPRRELMMQSLSANPRTKLLLDKLPIKSKTGKVQFTGPEAALEALDWQNGIRFMPTSIPKFYGQRLLGSMAMFFDWIFLGPGSIDSAAYWVLTSNPGSFSLPFSLNIYVPSNPATYLVTLHFLTGDGHCPAEWVTLGQDKLGVINIVVNDQSLNLTPLADGSGYIGLVTLTPAPFNFAAGSNMHLHCLILKDRAPANKPWVSMVFNGITIARLQ